MSQPRLIVLQLAPFHGHTDRQFDGEITLSCFFLKCRRYTCLMRSPPASSGARCFVMVSAIHSRASSLRSHGLVITLVWFINCSFYRMPQKQVAGKMLYCFRPSS